MSESDELRHEYIVELREENEALKKERDAVIKSMQSGVKTIPMCDADRIAEVSVRQDQELAELRRELGRLVQERNDLICARKNDAKLSSTLIESLTDNLVTVARERDSLTETHTDPIGERCWNACLLTALPPTHDTYPFAIYMRVELLERELRRIKDAIQIEVPRLVVYSGNASKQESEGNWRMAKEYWKDFDYTTKRILGLSLPNAQLPPSL